MSNDLTKMASSFLLLALYCILNSHYASATANRTSDISVSTMDKATAMHITSLLQENYDESFSWNDSKLVELLSRGVTSDSTTSQILVKRVDGTPFGAKIPKTGSLLTFRQCVGCTQPATGEGWTIDDFTVDFFLKSRLIPTEQLTDNCVFYTQRADREDEGGSKLATEWACGHTPNKLRTIWNLWPYNTVNDDGNFWVVLANSLTNKNWLYNVWFADDQWKQQNAYDNYALNQGAVNTFFGRMSQAMALSCKGTVYVMTDDPNNLPTGGIWALVEYPTLQYQYRAGIITDCIAVAYSKPANTAPVSLQGGSGSPPYRRDVYGRDFNRTFDLEEIIRREEKKPWKAKKDEEFRIRMRDLYERSNIQERDSCLGGQPYELPGLDYFGYGV